MYHRFTFCAGKVIINSEFTLLQSKYALPSPGFLLVANTAVITEGEDIVRVLASCLQTSVSAAITGRAESASHKRSMTSYHIARAWCSGGKCACDFIHDERSTKCWSFALDVKNDYP
jgi:hypothetical protein